MIDELKLKIFVFRTRLGLSLLFLALRAFPNDWARESMRNHIITMLADIRDQSKEKVLAGTNDRPF